MQHWGFMRKNGKSGNICIAAGNTLLPFPAKMMISNRSRLSVFLERTSAASLTVSRFWKQLISSTTLRDMFRPRSVKSTFKAFLKCWMRQKKEIWLTAGREWSSFMYLFIFGGFFFLVIQPRQTQSIVKKSPYALQIERSAQSNARFISKSHPKLPCWAMTASCHGRLLQ